MLSAALLSLTFGSLATTTFAAPAPRASKSSDLHIFLDFDDTIVISDAYSTLAYSAYDSLPANSSILSWDEIESVYGQIYDAASQNISEPTNLDEAIKYSNNDVYTAIEEWSFIWVKNTGLFDTVKYSELVKYASNVTLRDGWCGFAQKAQDEGVHINVISRSWSPSWIRLVLQKASTCPEVTSTISTYCPEILPQGNKAVLPYSELNHDAPVYNGQQKVDIVKKILKDNGGTNNQSRIVFTSDGKADIQALWELPTTIGVAAGADNSAAKSFAKYGKTVWNASEGWQGFTGEAGNSSSIYVIESFSELQSLLWY